MQKGNKSAIVLAVDSMKPIPSPPQGFDVPSKAEGYAIWTENHKVYLLGRDDRGVLFAAGRLIRLLSMSKGRVCIPADLRLLAGHHEK